MHVTRAQGSEPAAPRSSHHVGHSPGCLILFLLAWVAAWTVIFSGVDFWSIRLYQVCHYDWFGTYRSITRGFASFVSPASFALAENAYFIWMDMYDPRRTMHEWAWYSGDPVNPDGEFNFVWGTSSGGWAKYPMSEWYAQWSLLTFLWLAAVYLGFSRRRNRFKGKLQPSSPPRASHGIGLGIRDAALPDHFESGD
jgi:hypothetical protein